MKKVVIYWSNICVLHKYEQEHLNTVKAKLLLHDIDLEIHYFGLAYPKRMSEAIANHEIPLPDIIISTDLEVFESEPIYNRFKDHLYNACDWFDFKKDSNLKDLFIDSRLVPFIAIPMVFYTNNKHLDQTSIYEQINKNIAFGGINNSAVKCILKSVWHRYGKEKAEMLLNNSTIFDMPIQAMQSVRIGNAETALVPTIYALRADNKKQFARISIDGTIVLPSFACALNTISELDAKLVLKEILTESFCNFFVSNGDLISCIENTLVPQWNELNVCKFHYPPSNWFMEVESSEFYNLYCDSLPQAVNYLKSI